MALSKQVLICLGRYRVADQAHKEILNQYRAFSEKYPLGTTVPESERPILDKLIADHDAADKAVSHAARLLAHYFSEDCGV